MCSAFLVFAGDMQNPMEHVADTIRTSLKTCCLRFCFSFDSEDANDIDDVDSGVT